MVRWTKWRDREEIRELWRLRFGDSESFIDWFFRERFSPDHSAVSVEDGRIVSSIQSYPFHIRIRDALLPCAVIAGVSTLPAYEGRGHMGRTMRFYMNGIAARGGTVIPYRPEILAMYQGFGHYPVSRTAYFSVSDPAALAAAENGAVLLDLRRDEAAMHACYFRFSQRYSGIISRTLADMRLKLADYAADGAGCIGVYEESVLRGYCVYFDRDGLYAEEFVAGDAACAETLLRALCQTALRSGKTVGGKLPPDISFPAGAVQEHLELNLRPMGVMGVADVSALLSSVCHGGAWRAEILDRTVAANHGVFDFAGRPSDRAPHFRIEAGRLAQFLCGYRSLLELADEGNALLYDPRAARELDAAFPQETCFIVDEY